MAVYLNDQKIADLTFCGIYTKQTHAHQDQFQNAWVTNQETILNLFIHLKDGNNIFWDKWFIVSCFLVTLAKLRGSSKVQTG